MGIVTLYLSVIVLLPLAAVFAKAGDNGLSAAWDVITSKEALATLKLTLVVSLIVTAINGVFGTIIAWVLVRDRFRGKGPLNAIIDLPFALPTIVAGLTLLTLYGPKGPFGFSVAYTRIGVAVALLFVTLPFVVRSVQPVMMELDPDAEEAAASLGAGSFTIFRRVILPSLLPAILGGMALAFARAIGEFGSVVLIGGGIPRETEVASQYIAKQIEIDRPTNAAAVSVVLLAASLVLLSGLTLVGRRWSR